MQMRTQPFRVLPAGCLVPSAQHFQRTGRHQGCPLPPSSSIPLTKGPGVISRGSPLQTDSPANENKENIETAQRTCVYDFN